MLGGSKTKIWCEGESESSSISSGECCQKWHQ